MKKYNVYITYNETRVLEVEAENEDQACDIACDNLDSAEPFGTSDYEYEVEEIEN